LDKWSGEVIDAVTTTVENIKDFYITEKKECKDEINSRV